MPDLGLSHADVRAFRLPGEPEVMAVSAPRGPARAERLERIWAERPGVFGWITTTDHKRIGLLYLFTSLVLFAAGGVEALLMRTQLIRPDNGLVGPAAYDQLFTMHGVTMIFFFVIPISTGAFGNYLLPLMIGARDMAFPRLNALSYWIFLASGILIYTSLAIGKAPDAGWFDYVPLADAQFSPGREHRLLLPRADPQRHLVDRRGGRTSSSRSSRAARPACRSTACRCSASRSWRSRSRWSSRCRR